MIKRELGGPTPVSSVLVFIGLQGMSFNQMYESQSQLLFQKIKTKILNHSFEQLGFCVCDHESVCIHTQDFNPDAFLL